MSDDVLKNAQATSPAINSNSDDDLNLDNLYDLSSVSKTSAGNTANTATPATPVTPATNVASLTANLPVDDNKLQSFRNQSPSLGEAGAQADIQVLADLALKAQNQEKVLPPTIAPVMPIVNPSESDVSLDLDQDLGGGDEWLAKLSDALQEDQAGVAKSAAPVLEVKPLEVIRKNTGEAAQLEADLEANILDLDAEEKTNDAPDDLFAVSASLPTLSKVSLSKNSVIPEEKRVAPVQKLMKTDTIYNKGDKNNHFNPNISADAKRLKSPVEELAEMTLEDWSRKGDIAVERAAKVKEQILSLGAKSIVNEIEGLNAWRRSVVSQKYLDLGIAAYLSEKSLEEIILEQKELSVEEWFTINQLNRELMI